MMKNTFEDIDVKEFHSRGRPAPDGAGHLSRTTTLSAYH